MRFKTAILSAALALSTAADANGRVQLLPAGEFVARDGRPGNGLTWKLSDAQGQALATALSAIAAKTPLVIDYEHQTLVAMTQGITAPASGWMKRFEWLSGQGLFADVDWTAKAKAAIDAKEYLYISPVITHDEKTGAVTGLAMAALTNYPGLLGMDPAKASALSALAATLNHTPETDLMDRTQLIALLGLQATATDADITNAITALRGRPAVPAAVTTALGLAATADEATALSAIAGLKQPGTQTMEIVTQLTGQVAALTTQLNDSKLTALVDGAIQSGKFLPAHRDWLLKQGRADFTALSGVVENAPVIPGLAGQVGDGAAARDAQGKVTALSATQALVAKQLGIDPAEYLKSLQPA